MNDKYVFKPIINELSKNNPNAKAVIKQEHNLYCDTCGQRTLSVTTYEDGSQYRFCEPCTTETELNNEITPLKQRIRSFKRHSAIPKDLKIASFNNFEVEPNNKIQKNVLSSAVSYAQLVTKDNGMRLILRGTRGIGKSHLAISILKYLWSKKDNDMTCLFISQQELLNKIRNSWKNGNTENEKRRYKEVDLLVIDDFGVEGTNQNDIKILTDIVNDRSGKAMIITTNLPDQIFSNDPLYNSVYSKIHDSTRSTCTVVEYTGNDRRLRNVKRINLSDTSINKAKNTIVNNKPNTNYDVDNPPF